MSKTARVLILAVMASLLMASGYGYEAPTPEPENHMLREAVYRQYLGTLTGIISLHEQMKADYEKELSKDVPDGEKERVRRFIRHCGSIISESKELRDDLQRFTEEHKKEKEEPSR